MIQGDAYSWSEESSKAWIAEPAVYELYQGNTLLYVGSTGDLKQRFIGYWNSKFSDDPCKKNTDVYKREYVQTEKEAQSKERTYLMEYQETHGRLPRCNQLVP